MECDYKPKTKKQKRKHSFPSLYKENLRDLSIGFLLQYPVKAVNQLSFITPIKPLMDQLLLSHSSNSLFSQKKFNFLNGGRRDSKFQQLPIFQLPKTRSNKVFVSKTNDQLPIMALLGKKKKPKIIIEDASEVMNAIASQNLDFAIARRGVRSAFTQLQQKLDHILFKDAPAEIRTEEWYERNSKGLEIFCKSWLPKLDEPIKGALFFCHGYGDTCTFYFEGIAKKIAASGYAIYAVDHPGFGLSEGLHGYIPSFDGLVDNVIERFNVIKGRPEVRGLPQFLLGQSMGGAVALKAHLKQPKAWDGIVLVAPMCKIAENVTPTPAVLKLFTILSNVPPKAKLSPETDLAELMFRDPRKKKMAVYNVISYNHRMRLKTAIELLKATRDIESQLEKVSSPLLVIHGAADKVTDPLVSKFLYEKASSKDKTLKLYPESYHCILEGEPDERISEVLADMVSWLDARCSSASSTSS